MARLKSLNDISAQMSRVQILNREITKKGGQNRADRIVRAANSARTSRRLSRFSPNRTTKRSSRLGLVSG